MRRFHLRHTLRSWLDHSSVSRAVQSEFNQIYPLCRFQTTEFNISCSQNLQAVRNLQRKAV